MERATPAQYSSAPPSSHAISASTTASAQADSHRSISRFLTRLRPLCFVVSGVVRMCLFPCAVALFAVWFWLLPEQP